MSWLVDGRTFARKVKNPAHSVCQDGRKGRSIECPSCGFLFDQNNQAPEWPGLPAGVKFDPSDQELLEHLAAKVGLNAVKSHPFIDEFIPTLNEEDGICYTHPERMPGVRSDGSSLHFFHRPARAYTTGTRKRRKVQQGDDSTGGCEVRWHKTGKTRPIIENGKQIGCKKIMVLYANQGKKGKAEKTNWVMHQYHLGTDEEEREGEFVVSKVFYQTQPRQPATVRREEEDETDQLTSEPIEPTFSFPQSSTNNTVPCTPRTPVSFQAEMTKQHKGLLMNISEDVNHLYASLSGNLCDVTEEPEQTKALQSVQRISDQGEKDTTCSSEGDQVGQPLEQPQGDQKSGAADCGSQQFSDTLDADLVKLLCNENIQKFLKLKNLKGMESSNEEAGQEADFALENIVLDTPPDFLSLESLINSQEALDWLGKRKFFSDSQKTLGPDDVTSLLDFIRDSQSSL